MSRNILKEFKLSVVKDYLEGDDEYLAEYQK